MMKSPQLKNHEKESEVFFAERKVIDEEHITFAETPHILKRKRKRKKGIRKGLFICVVSLLSALLLTSVAFNVIQFKYWNDKNSVIAGNRDEIDLLSRENAKIKEELKEAQSVIEEKENQIGENILTISNNQTTIETLENELNLYQFYIKNAVVVPMDNTELYHRYGCGKLDISSGYWIYNVSLAKSKGFSPCKNCIK